MSAPTPVLDFIHATSYGSLPGEVRHQMRCCLLDTVGVAAAGTATPLSRILRDHAHRQAPGRADLAEPVAGRSFGLTRCRGS